MSLEVIGLGLALFSLIAGVALWHQKTISRLLHLTSRTLEVVTKIQDSFPIEEVIQLMRNQSTLMKEVERSIAQSADARRIEMEGVVKLVETVRREFAKEVAIHGEILRDLKQRGK